MAQQKTKKAYEHLLNELGQSLYEEDFWFGGKNYYRFGTYGSSMRRHDPILFEVGYSDWKRNK